MTRERFQVGTEILDIDAELVEGRLRIRDGEGESTWPVQPLEGETYLVSRNGRRIRAVVHCRRDRRYVHIDGHAIELKTFVGSAAEASDGGSFDGRLKPPMPGNVVKILVEQGDRVDKDQPLVIIESMKMEHPVTAPVAGEVTAVHVREGDLAELDRVLLDLTPDP